MKLKVDESTFANPNAHGYAKRLAVWKYLRKRLKRPTAEEVALATGVGVPTAKKYLKELIGG